jgi:hypothetical protein
MSPEEIAMRKLRCTEHQIIAVLNLSKPDEQSTLCATKLLALELWDEEAYQGKITKSNSQQALTLYTFHPAQLFSSFFSTLP